MFSFGTYKEYRRVDGYISILKIMLKYGRNSDANERIWDLKCSKDVRHQDDFLLLFIFIDKV